MNSTYTEVRPPALLPSVDTYSSIAPQVARLQRYFQDRGKPANEATGRLEVARTYARASQSTGGIVRIEPDCACIPYIVGRDGEPVLVYRLVEVLDEHVDLEAVQKDLPNLTIGQIAAALQFVRKLSQFNTRMVDIDEEIDRHWEESNAFQDTVRRALACEDDLRVLPI